jgi:hypothetical protein
MAVKPPKKGCRLLGKHRDPTLRLRLELVEGSALTGNLLFVVGCLAKEAIPKDASDAGVAGVEAPAHATLGVVGKVLGVVAPPGTVVIPQMVEGVA